jgi:subtilisin-like proprotein convertase family protein
MLNAYHILFAMLLWHLASATAFTQVPGFGPVDDKKPVVGFGQQAELAKNITAAEWEFTVAYMKRADRNKSGWLERDELKHFNDAKFNQADLDKDGRLSMYEKTLEGISFRQQAQKRQRLTREVQIIEGVEVTAADRRAADYTMKKFDKNKNGILDVDEIPGSWKTTTLQDTDLDKDGRVSLRELQRRVSLNRAVGEKRRRESEQRDDLLSKQRRECWNLAAELIGRHDRNKDNSLDRSEWPAVGRDVGQADTNSNGFIDRTELSDWMAARLALQPGLRLPRGVPDWFLERDKNYDGQIVMTEYASVLDDKTVAEFSKYDKNGDGFVTARESLAASRGKERFVSDAELIIEPRFGVYSEILVREDFKIGDIDVQLSIFHAGVEQLAATLISPTGKRVELFAGEGKRWRGRNFEDTVFDDEAEKSIGLPDARPPFRGSVQPDGTNVPDKTSLSTFYGASVRGTWRLYVQATRSNQPGVLHGWALHVQREAGPSSKSR